MADGRITQFDLASPLSSSDVIVVVQGTRTKQATMEQVKALTDDACECTLASRYTSVGTDANTLKKFLYTYTLRADLITTDGSWLDIHIAGTFAANGNNKTASLNVKQNSTGLNVSFAIPSSNYNNDIWYIDARIQRSGDLTYVIAGNGTVMDATVLNNPQSIPIYGDGNGCDWTAGDLQICVTGTNSTAAANDITCGTFIINAHLLDPNS